MLPEALEIDSVAIIDMYTVLMCVGIVCALFVFDRYTTKIGMPGDTQRFYLIVVILSIALGIGSSALFQAIYFWAKEGVFSFENGMTFLGGLLGGVASFAILWLVGNAITKNKHKSWAKVVVWTAPACITIAHFFGRLGCFCAGCCYGIESDLLGLHFTHLNYNGVDEQTLLNPASYRVLPTQLYEAAVLFGLFFLTSRLFFKRPKFAMPTYALTYGIARFCIEFLRNDSRGAFLFGLSPSQIISLALIVAGGIWLGLAIVARVSDPSGVQATDGLFDPARKTAGAKPAAVAADGTLPGSADAQAETPSEPASPDIPGNDSEEDSP